MRRRRWRGCHTPAWVGLFDYDLTPASQPFMVMELVRGESLQTRLDRSGALDPDDAVAVTLSLCDAVAACHAAGVLHRDIKPDNVLVDEQGRIRLVDFGITRDSDSSLTRTRLTVQGKCLGSPGYWAPEQALGKLDTIGETTDVYGVGATLFALLAGQPPHHGETLPEILRAVTEQKPPPSALNPAVPAWLDEVVGRALETDRRHRFPTVEALAAALTRGAASPAPRSLVGALAVGLSGVVALL